jgi:hypothetical protein
MPFPCSQPNSYIVAEIQSAFSFLYVHSKYEYHSFIHHTMAVKRRLEAYEIGSQAKYKICDMGLCIVGCFEDCSTKTCHLDDGVGS